MGNLLEHEENMIMWKFAGKPWEHCWTMMKKWWANDENMMGEWWEHDGLLRLRCKMMETMVISWIRIFDGIWFMVIFDGAIWWDITNQHFTLVYICYIWVWLNIWELALIIDNHAIWCTSFSDKPGWFVAFWAWWWWWWGRGGGGGGGWLRWSIWLRTYTCKPRVTNTYIASN